MVVTFDIVRTPQDFEIYGLTIEEATTEFPVFTFTQSPENAGLCFDADATYDGTIRRIDPLPEEILLFEEGMYEILYWLATTSAGPPACPPYTPPP